MDRVPKADEYNLAYLGNLPDDKKVMKLGDLNKFACEDLILSINGNTMAGRVAFNLVKNSKSDEYPK